MRPIFASGIGTRGCGLVWRNLWGPLVDRRAQKITRDVAVAEIARRYREFVDIFENARIRTAAGVS